MSNDRLEPFIYHNITFKRCADVVSLGRLDRLWFFRHHWFLKIGWLGKKWGSRHKPVDWIISVFGCLKPVQNSYFRSRPAIFRFSGALLFNYWLSSSFNYWLGSSYYSYLFSHSLNNILVCRNHLITWTVIVHTSGCLLPRIRFLFGDLCLPKTGI